MFFTRKVKQFILSWATFFYFHFISVSPNHANIGVDFAHHFDFFFKISYYLGNMWFIAKK